MNVYFCSCCQTKTVNVRNISSKGNRSQIRIILTCMLSLAPGTPSILTILSAEKGCNQIMELSNGQRMVNLDSAHRGVLVIHYGTTGGSVWLRSYLTIYKVSRKNDWWLHVRQGLLSRCDFLPFGTTPIITLVFKVWNGNCYQERRLSTSHSTSSNETVSC